MEDFVTNSTPVDIQGKIVSFNPKKKELLIYYGKKRGIVEITDRTKFENKKLKNANEEIKVFVLKHVAVDIKGYVSKIDNRGTIFAATIITFPKEKEKKKVKK